MVKIIRSAKRRIARKSRVLFSYVTHRLVVLAVAASKILPLSNQVALKQRQNPLGYLDYGKMKIRMRVDSDWEFYRLRSCAKEPETVQWIEESMRPGDVFYDIGANVGAYSFVAYAAASGQCAVYAFEPSFSTFAALSHNVVLNGCQGRIVPLNIALSDRTELLTLNYSSITPGVAMHWLGQHAGQDEASFKTAFAQPVLTYRLDDLIRQFDLPLPNHVKLDTDGGELDVLRGAQDILAQPCLRTLLVEVDEQRYPHREIPSLLENKGFRMLSKHPRGQLQTLFNCIFKK